MGMTRTRISTGDSNSIGTRIVGVGRYLPSRKISNRDLCKEFPVLNDKLTKIVAHVNEKRGKAYKCNEDYIEEVYGLTTRYWTGPGETMSLMAENAINDVFSNTGYRWDDIDYVITAGASPAHLIPDNWATYSNHIKPSKNIPGHHVHTTCLSFLTALHSADAFIRSCDYKRILIVNVELSHKSINPRDPKSFCIIGDMATAVIVEADETGKSKIISHLFETHGKFSRDIGVDIGMDKHPMDEYKSPTETMDEYKSPTETMDEYKSPTETMDEYKSPTETEDLSDTSSNSSKDDPIKTSDTYEDWQFHMNGKMIASSTISVLPAFFQKLCPPPSTEVTAYISHQPSKMGVDHIKEIFGDKLITSFEDYGNSVSCCLPNNLYLAIEQKKINRGDKFLLMGAGAGIHIAAIVLVF